MSRDLYCWTVRKACSPPGLQDSSQELVQFLAASPRWQDLRHQVESLPAVRFKQGEVLSAEFTLRVGPWPCR
jgi:hypothetical protein